jgi:2-keto-3-deoxy-L-rhamnonate aldolase RhmA
MRSVHGDGLTKAYEAPVVNGQRERRRPPGPISSAATMSQNPVTRAIEERGAAIGAMLFEFDTPAIMRILAAAGADFALFDLEHTGWDAGTLRRALATGRGTGVYPITRVVRAEYELVASALDAGARGVMAPMVESADDARRLVDSAKYPPVGRRGFGVIMSDDLADGGPGALAERSNREGLVIAQIESPRGIEHADEIVAVPGVDVVWLGQFDLSLALGVPGRFSDPTYVAAVERLIGVCRSHGKPLGQLIGSAEEGAALREQGFQVLAFADVWVFERALRERIDLLRP